MRGRIARSWHPSSRCSSPWGAAPRPSRAVATPAGSPRPPQAAPDASALQMRPVESITAPGTDAYDRAGADVRCRRRFALHRGAAPRSRRHHARRRRREPLRAGAHPRGRDERDLSDRRGSRRRDLGRPGRARPRGDDRVRVGDRGRRDLDATREPGRDRRGRLVVSAPVVQARIDSGQVQISGGFTQQEAEDLAAALGGS